MCKIDDDQLRNWCSKVFLSKSNFLDSSFQFQAFSSACESDRHFSQIKIRLNFHTHQSSSDKFQMSTVEGEKVIQ